jgi:hypothetical protein
MGPMDEIIECGECHLQTEVTLTPAQGLPLTVAQREIGPMSLDDANRCSFGNPGTCPHFKRAIDAAIAAGRFSGRP